MNSTYLITLLQRSESETLDFKQKQYLFVGAGDDDKAELLKDILSMANTTGTSAKYILIGVVEEHGQAIRLCGADVLADNDVQQFVNAKTNRPVSFRIENCSHQGVNVTIIQIGGDQRRPLYLKRDYGWLKGNSVYVRRGSATDTASPDEIAYIGQQQIAEDQKQQNSELFWQEVNDLLAIVERRVLFLKSFPRIYDATIAEHRLPLANAKILLQRSREVGVSDDFRARFSRVVEVMETIDAYMSMGEEKLNKWTSNLRSYTEELYELARKLKEDQLR